MADVKHWVEVVYAIPGAQVRRVALGEGMTVLEAIRRSGLLVDYPALDLRRHRVGIFGRIVSIATYVAHGERIEVYDPLPEDPKDRRRARAKSASRKYFSG